MRAIWNGFISFGLVTIPVSVGLAQQRSDVSFRTLSRETRPAGQAEALGPERDVEVTPDDTVKGWEVSKGRYLPVEDAELERFAARQEKTIQILQFVELAEVDPVYFERAYWLEPQERAERPYELLMTAMEQKGRAAIGRFVLSTKEHLVLLRAVGRDAHARDALLPRGHPPAATSDEISGRLEDVEVADGGARDGGAARRRAWPGRSSRRPTPTRPARRCSSSSQAKADGERDRRAGGGSASRRRSST